MNYILTSNHCWGYGSYGHPESPDRVRNSYQYLSSLGKYNFEFVDEPVEEKILLTTHTKNLIKNVKEGNFFDPDTPDYKNIYFYAAVSVNITVTSLDKCLDRSKVFGLTRPPGHHAGKNFLGGFCYFNNIAVAVNSYLNSFPGNKAAILDIDAHHGNGTQEIFLHNSQVLYVSLHQIYIYPGTGLKSEDNCINYPLSPGTEDKEYLHILYKALEKIKNFSPSLLAVSIGFDTYRNDPLTQLCLSQECYTEIGKLLSEINLPTFCVLEGGYSKDLPVLIDKFLTGYFRDR